MNTDHYFEQGHSHEVCQDYACSGETDHLVYAVVADGCSQSPQSDIGARIISKAFVSSAQKSLIGYANYSIEKLSCFYGNLTKGFVLEKMENVKEELELDEQSLDATLVAAVYNKSEGNLNLFMWGDGHIVLKYKDRLERYIGSYPPYPHNAPFYINYETNEARRRAYLKHFVTSNAFIKKTIEEGPTLTHISVTEHERFFLQVNDLAGLEFVLVASDGLDSFKSGSTEEPIDVFPEFTKFKSLTGEFVQRRMKRFRQDTKALGNHHDDDIASAAISFV